MGIVSAVIHPFRHLHTGFLVKIHLPPFYSLNPAKMIDFYHCHVKEVIFSGYHISDVEEISGELR